MPEILARVITKILGGIENVIHVLGLSFLKSGRTQN
jgi:hypothetical protein